MVFRASSPSSSGVKGLFHALIVSECLSFKHFMFDFGLAVARLDTFVDCFVMACLSKRCGSVRSRVGNGKSRPGGVQGSGFRVSEVPDASESH